MDEKFQILSVKKKEIKELESKLTASPNCMNVLYLEVIIICFFLYIFSAGSNVFNHDARSVSTEFKAPSVGGWMGGAGPPSMVTSGSGTGTLTKRSTSRNAMHLPPARQLSGPDALVKDYNKKRWLILALLSVEIETVVTTQHPLETTRENLQALLSNWLV